MYLPLEGNIQQAHYERQSEVCVFRGYSLPIHQAMGMPTFIPINLAIFHSFSKRGDDWHCTLSFPNDYFVDSAFLP